MTPEALAALHARAFAVPPPWTAAAMAAALDEPGTFLLAEPAAGIAPPVPARAEPAGHPGRGEGGGLAGFLLGRAAAGEAEVLTLAVEPGLRGRGTGGRLVARFLAEAAARGAARAFLEVAADNAAACAVYARAGFAEVGRRRGYYRHPDGRGVDALVMARDLPGALPGS